MLTQECEAMGICMRLIPREDASYKPLEMGEKTFEPQFKPKPTYKPKTNRVSYDKVQLKGLSKHSSRQIVSLFR